MAGALDCRSQLSLMLGAVAGDSSGKDLAALGDISLKLVHVLVIDLIVLAAENADFLPSVESAFSSESAFTVCSLKCHDLYLLKKRMFSTFS